MKMRKLFAGIAAAATMLGGLAIGATASAANGQPTTDTFPLKFQAAEQSRLENRDLTAYKLADYVEYTTGTDPQTKQYAIQTVEVDDVTDAIRTALMTVVKSADPQKPSLVVPQSGDPMAWASQQGIWDQSVTKPYAEGTMDGKGSDSQKQIAGSSRKFADALKSAAGEGKLGEGVKLTLGQPTCTADICTVTASAPYDEGTEPPVNLALGVYLIVDKAKASTTTPENPTDVTTSQAIATIVSPGKVADDHRIVVPDNNDWTVTIDMKNEVTPVAKAVADKDTVPGVGDTRVWTVTSNVPNWVGKDLNSPDTKFLFTDTPGKGQTVDFSSIKITIGEEPDSIYTSSMLAKPTAAAESDKWDANGTDSFTVNLTDYMKTVALAGASSKIDQAITMTYSSTVNAEAVKLAKDGKITNRVEVNNNGGTADASAELPKPVSFEFTKMNVDETPLAGAHFSLTRASETAGAYAAKNDEFMKVTRDTAETDGVYTINPNVDGAVAADGKGTNPLISGKDGKVVVNGVGEGTYTLKETKAPEGYWQNEAVLPTFTITVSKDGILTVKGDALDLVNATHTDNVSDSDIKVRNVMNITQLPLTGAAGIALFTVIGLLVLGVGVGVFVKSRSTRKAMMA